jgi:hypothetical protein
MLVIYMSFTIDDVIEKYDNISYVSANVVFYLKLGIKGNTPYEDAYYKNINKDIWKGSLTYQNGEFLYKFITQKKQKEVELYLAGDNEANFRFEIKYDGKVQPVNAWDWAYFAIYKVPKALKEHNYEIIQNGNWFIFRKGIREIRMLISNDYKILKVEYYKRGAIKGILEFSNVVIQ